MVAFNYRPLRFNIIHTDTIQSSLRAQHGVILERSRTV
ncbi:MAG: hypothetical protein ACI8RD_008808 [Bacillariaceae sp.]|jgi:hypothetical protein